MTTTFSRKNPTHEVYINVEPLHVRELYPFIKKYVTQTGGRTRKRKRRKRRTLRK